MSDLQTKIEQQRKTIAGMKKQRDAVVVEWDKRIEVEERELKRLLASSLPEPEWGWSVNNYTAPKPNKMWGGPEEGTDIVELRMVITNYDEIKSAYELAMVSIEDQDQHNKGLVYYRKNKVLLHHGGGHHVIAGEYPIVEDDEWEAIKQGNVPERLINGHLKKRFGVSDGE